MVLSDQVAVMHEGRVLQVAPPETVYTRPASRAVAAFVGMPNLLSAKVLETRPAGDGVLARVGGDGWDGWCSGPADLRAGEAVTVIVRPEAVQLNRSLPPPGLEWVGTVTRRFFRGARNLYAIDVGAHRLHADAPPDQSLAPGSGVTLAIAAAHAWAVRE